MRVCRDRENVASTAATYTRAHKHESSPPRLHEIRVPTLILTGDADIPDVHAHAGAIEAGIPNARRVVVAGHRAYHVPWKTNGGQPIGHQFYRAEQ